MNTSATIGIRETRRLDGAYAMTKDDIVSNRKFEDSIALGVWPIDCLLYTSPSPRDTERSRMPSSA